jgi:hypothetical protein
MTTHDARIARAAHLAVTHPAAAPLLHFYSELARFQKPVFTELQSKSQTDLRALVCHFPALIKLVASAGTELLASFAASNLHSTDDRLELLLATWEGGEALHPAARFYARVLLQPFAEYLASRGDIQASGAGPRCPFCNARPVAGVLCGARASAGSCARSAPPSGSSGCAPVAAKRIRTNFRSTPLPSSPQPAWMLAIVAKLISSRST